jgi:hypothetical protein
MNQIKIIILSFFLLGGISKSYSQRCNGKYEVLVSKGDTIIVKCKELVLLNGETYADYYYKEYELNELKKLIPDYKVKIDSVERELRRNGKDYVGILTKKDSLISIVQADRLQLRGLLRDCNSRYKREKVLKEKYKHKLFRARMYQIVTTSLFVFTITLTILMNNK